MPEMAFLRTRNGPSTSMLGSWSFNTQYSVSTLYQTSLPLTFYVTRQLSTPSYLLDYNHLNRPLPQTRKFVASTPTNKGCSSLSVQTMTCHPRGKLSSFWSRDCTVVSRCSAGTGSTRTERREFCPHGAFWDGVKCLLRSIVHFEAVVLSLLRS